jgi:predicted enzyme related to lactoylglutathione lyase
MTTTTSHAPGTFCWIELATTDPAGARSYYTQLFDWTVREFPMGDQGTYYMFQNNDRDAAAMYKGDQPGVPPNWMSYVSVADADATAEKAKSLGGNVVAGPFDVYDFGRMAVITDPQGATFSIWQAKSHIGVGVRDENNALCWNELHAVDTAAATKFYTALFGWTAKESPEYTEWHLGDRAIGGMLPARMPPATFWLPYFAVADCDATYQKGQQLGGHGHVPPTNIDKVGTFAVLNDPQGAFFCIIKLTM